LTSWTISVVKSSSPWPLAPPDGMPEFEGNKRLSHFYQVIGGSHRQMKVKNSPKQKQKVNIVGFGSSNVIIF
jgi:hypothetical protein